MTTNLNISKFVHFATITCVEYFYSIINSANSNMYLIVLNFVYNFKIYVDVYFLKEGTEKF